MDLTVSNQNLSRCLSNLPLIKHNEVYEYYVICSILSKHQDSANTNTIIRQHCLRTPLLSLRKRSSASMEMSSISSSISSAILPFCSDRCSDLLKVCGLFVKLRLQKIIFFSIFLQKSKHLQVLNQFLNHYLSQFNSLYDRTSLTLSFGSHPHNHHLQETSNVTFNLKKIIIHMKNLSLVIFKMHFIFLCSWI